MFCNFCTFFSKKFFFSVHQISNKKRHCGSCLFSMLVHQRQQNPNFCVFSLNFLKNYFFSIHQISDKNRRCGICILFFPEKVCNTSIHVNKSLRRLILTKDNKYLDKTGIPTFVFFGGSLIFFFDDLRFFFRRPPDFFFDDLRIFFSLTSGFF